ncbi:MAG: hypothetical protein WC223_13810 [Bacteroidales bacterium]|jgi:hypothetical protein
MNPKHNDFFKINFKKIRELDFIQLYTDFNDCYVIVDNKQSNAVFIKTSLVEVYKIIFAIHSNYLNNLNKTI